MFSVFKNNCSLFVLLTCSAKTVFKESKKRLNLHVFNLFWQFLPLNVLGPVSNISSKSVLFTVDFVKTEEIDFSLKCIIYPLSNARNAPFELSGASSWLSLSFSHFYSFPSPVSLCQRGWCCQAAKTLWYPFCMLVRKKHSYEYSGHSAISRRGKKDGRLQNESGQKCSFVLIWSASVMEGSSSEANGLL